MWSRLDTIGVAFSTALATALMLLFFSAKAHSHDGHHGVGHDHDTRLGQWHRTLMRPDIPHSSCCNDKDCRPTHARLAGGIWQAQKDGKWIDVPASKINREESHDSQAHTCAPPASNPTYPANFVFCFVKPGPGL